MDSSPDYGEIPMEMTSAIEITSEQRDLLVSVLRQFIPGVAIWAYGSRVRRTSRAHSDLDLVVFATPDQQASVCDLREALDESNLPFLVDLPVWDDLPARFQDFIRQEYFIIQ